MQVQATLTQSGTLCNAMAVQYPSADQKSVAINARAIPTLNASATSAKSTAFNAVTGATITSQAYKSSLQSILDAL